MTDDTDAGTDTGPENDAEFGTTTGTYLGAPDSLIETWNIRRRPLHSNPGEGLPPLDVDLKALLNQRVAEEAPPPRPATAFALKRHEIRREFVGSTELAALNALLISHLRKTGAPRYTGALFRRIWAEEADALLAELSPRWLISSAITFGDHGSNELQRRIGLSMNMLFSLMKLYEFERLYSGRAPTEAFGMRSTGDKKLPLNMPRFSLLGGGLDVNLLAQVWQMALNEPVAGRLACHLLQLLNDDPGNLFRRIDLMRDAVELRRSTRAERTAATAARRAAAARQIRDAAQIDAPEQEPEPGIERGAEPGEATEAPHP